MNILYIYIYIRLKVQLDAHGFVCILYFTIFALHVSGAICTHHQEHKLQSTAIDVCNGYGIGAGTGWDTLTLLAWST
jgi:hypothetical protein